MKYYATFQNFAGQIDVYGIGHDEKSALEDTKQYENPEHVEVTECTEQAYQYALNFGTDMKYFFNGNGVLDVKPVKTLYEEAMDRYEALMPKIEKTDKDLDVLCEISKVVYLLKKLHKMDNDGSITNSEAFELMCKILITDCHDAETQL